MTDSVSIVESGRFSTGGQHEAGGTVHAFLAKAAQPSGGWYHGGTSPVRQPQWLLMDATGEAEIPILPTTKERMELKEP